MSHTFAEEEDLEAWKVNRYLNHSLQFEHRVGLEAFELLQPSSEIDVTHLSITRQGRMVIVNFNWAFNDNVFAPPEIGAGGNLGNWLIARVGDMSVAYQAWWPVALSGGCSTAAGRMATYSVDTYGRIEVAAVAPGPALVVGETLSCNLVYATRDAFDENGRGVS